MKPVYSGHATERTLVFNTHTFLGTKPESYGQTLLLESKVSAIYMFDCNVKSVNNFFIKDLDMTTFVCYRKQVWDNFGPIRLHVLKILTNHAICSDNMDQSRYMFGKYIKREQNVTHVSIKMSILFFLRNWFQHRWLLFILYFWF